MSAWILPTTRATSWGPLAGVAGCLAAVTAVAAYAGTWPVGQLTITAAALAAAVVAGLHDPAASLLAAMPTSAAVRRARRQLLLVPVGLAVWLAYLGLGHVWQPGVGWPLGEVAALTATGFAVQAWAPPQVALEAGVAAPVVWFVAAWAGGGREGDLAAVLLAWQHHPWIVTLAAAAALLAGRSR